MFHDLPPGKSRCVIDSLCAADITVDIAVSACKTATHMRARTHASVLGTTWMWETRRLRWIQALWREFRSLKFKASIKWPGMYFITWRFQPSSRAQALCLDPGAECRCATQGTRQSKCIGFPCTLCSSSVVPVPHRCPSPSFSFYTCPFRWCQVLIVA